MENKTASENTVAKKEVGSDWTIQKVLHWTTQHFNSKQIPAARLDAELLLAHTLSCKRIDLYVRFDQPVQQQELNTLKAMIKRRTAFEPVAYILGRQEFYGRNFIVGPGVLIPRPETEHIVDEALKVPAAFSVCAEQNIPAEVKSLRILDIATGSGCLAATLALEIPNSQVTAVEISKEAAAYAMKNFEMLNAKVELVVEDFEVWAKEALHPEKADGTYDVIVSNPPYISQNANLMKDVKEFEPALALYGGEVGHELIFRWLKLIENKLNPGGVILFEIGHDQKEVLEKELQLKENMTLSFIKDYSGVSRIAKITHQEK